MPVFCLRAALLAVLLTLHGAAGAQVPGSAQAYEARVPVADQSADARSGALREALRQVVTRISGEDAPYLAETVIAQADALVQRYGYERTPEGGLLLAAGFDGRAVEQRLKQLGLPIWGVVAADVEEVDLQVSGITGAQDYADVIATLRALPGVRAVRPLRAQADVLQLRVRAEGGAGRLSGALLASGRLFADPAGGAELSYRLATRALP